MCKRNTQTHCFGQVASLQTLFHFFPSFCWCLLAGRQGQSFVWWVQLSTIKSSVRWHGSRQTSTPTALHGTPFVADALSGEHIHPFFGAVQADPGHACPVRNWFCSRKQETSVFPTGKRATKKTGTRKRGEKNISFRADCKFQAKKSNDYLTKATLGSLLWVEILPTIVGKDAKQNEGFTRPPPDGRRSGGYEGLGVRLLSTQHSHVTGCYWQLPGKRACNNW